MRTHRRPALCRFHAALHAALLLLLLAPGATIAQTGGLQVDFTMAMQGLNFDPVTLDANGRDGAPGNGMPDAMEMALVSAVLANPTLDFSAQGGVSHAEVRAAFEQALMSAEVDLGPLRSTWPTSPTVAAGYALLGEPAFTMYSTMSAGFGAPLDGDYALALGVGASLAAEGDADGDGVSNLEEYLVQGDAEPARFVAAALDPTVSVRGSASANSVAATSRRKTLGIVLYPGFEVLDVYGPLEMWAYVPDLEVILIAEEAGPVMSAQGVSSLATHSFASAPPLDIVMVPGGTGTQVQLDNPRLIDYLRRTNETSEYTTSVCTGAALLAKAGLLDGQRATTNKRFFFMAEQQSREVSWVADARWVESGKYFTSSGVSAGTDMALGLIAKLHGLDAARGLASSLEYTWHEQADEDPFAEFVRRLEPETDATGAFLRAEPAPDTTSAAPPWLRLYFNKLPNIERSRVQLFFSDTGREIPLRGMHTMGANDLMIEVSESLSPGIYHVKWESALGADAEPVQGQYAFEVSR